MAIMRLEKLSDLGVSACMYGAGERSKLVYGQSDVIRGDEMKSTRVENIRCSSESGVSALKRCWTTKERKKFNWPKNLDLARFCRLAGSSHVKSCTSIVPIDSIFSPSLCSKSNQLPATAACLPLKSQRTKKEQRKWLQAQSAAKDLSVDAVVATGWHFYI